MKQIIKIRGKIWSGNTVDGNQGLSYRPWEGGVQSPGWKKSCWLDINCWLTPLKSLGWPRPQFLNKNFMGTMQKKTLKNRRQISHFWSPISPIALFFKKIRYKCENKQIFFWDDKEKDREQAWVATRRKHTDHSASAPPTFGFDDNCAEQAKKIHPREVRALVVVVDCGDGGGGLFISISNVRRNLLWPKCPYTHLDKKKAALGAQKQPRLPCQKRGRNNMILMFDEKIPYKMSHQK